MKKISFLLLALWLFLGLGCTKYNFEETGRANGIHNSTMWEYLQSDPYNYSFLIPLIERADLRQIFDGSSQYAKDITFFAITNHSIRRYFLMQWENKDGLSTEEVQQKTDADILEAIQSLPVETARQMILSSVLPKRLMLEDFPSGQASTDPDNIIGKGGEKYTMLSGKVLWIYSFQEDYNGIPRTGRNVLYLVSEETQKSVSVASHNIQTQTGVVHSLQHLRFTLNDF